LIVRLKNPGKRLPNVEAEPNFYAMPFLPASLKPPRAPAAAALFNAPVAAPTMASANYALANLFQNYQNAVAQATTAPAAAAYPQQFQVPPSIYNYNPATQATTFAAAYPQQFQVPPSIYNYNSAPPEISLIDVINQQAALQNAGYQMPGAGAFPSIITHLSTPGAPSNIRQMHQQASSFAQYTGGGHPLYSGQNLAAAHSSGTSTSIQGANLGNLSDPFSSVAATPASLVAQNHDGLSSINFTNLSQTREVARTDLPSNAAQPPPPNALPNNLSRESTFLLSNPPNLNHPILQEFAALYLASLNNSNERSEGGNGGGSSSDAYRKDGVG
jgi:hypothetical protein